MANPFFTLPAQWVLFTPENFALVQAPLLDLFKKVPPAELYHALCAIESLPAALKPLRTALKELAALAYEQTLLCTLRDRLSQDRIEMHQTGKVLSFCDFEGGSVSLDDLPTSAQAYCEELAHLDYQVCFDSDYALA